MWYYRETLSSLSTLLVDAIVQVEIDNDKDPLVSENLLLYAEDTSVEP